MKHLKTQVNNDAINDFEKVLTKNVKSSLLMKSNFDGLVSNMQNPSSVTFVPQFGVFLVAERNSSRIGVYEENFQFRTWLQFSTSDHPLMDPTKMLCLSSGFLIIVDKESLHIYDASLTLVKILFGSFHGLAEGSSGLIFTLQKSSDRYCINSLNTKNCTEDKWTSSSELVASQEFPNWEMKSKCTCILFHQNLVYVLDTGLQNLYIVDTLTRNQRTSSITLEHPTGLLLIGNNNLLISDCCRIIAWNLTLKTAEILLDGIPFFSDLVEHDDSILAVVSSHKKSAKILKFSLGSVRDDDEDDFIGAWFEHAMCKNLEQNR